MYIIILCFVLYNRLDSGDIWVRSAIEVFDYMKDGHKTTFDYQIGLNPTDYKLALYRCVLYS